MTFIVNLVLVHYFLMIIKLNGSAFAVTILSDKAVAGVFARLMVFIQI